jgi:hypothetical protein
MTSSHPSRKRAFQQVQVTFRGGLNALAGKDVAHEHLPLSSFWAFNTECEFRRRYSQDEPLHSLITGMVASMGTGVRGKHMAAAR